MKQQYRVTAGKVTVETAVTGGRALIDIFRGDILPDDVPAEQIETELRLGTIEAVARRAEPETAEGDSSAVDDDDAGTQPPELPQGMSVSTTLEWVNAEKDQIGDRAAVALSAETAPGGKARSTLIERLQETLLEQLQIQETAASTEGGGPDAGAGAGASVDS